VKLPRFGLLLACLVYVPLAGAVSLGQIDNFEDGTLMGWSMGVGRSGSPVTNVPTGGPAGADDNFLRVFSTGNASTGFPRLTAFNDDARWLGNYVTANVTAIRMDLRNFGATELSIRIALRDSTGAAAPTALSKTAVVLPVGGGWTTAMFSLANADLIFEDGASSSDPSLNPLMSPVDLRIFHAATAVYPGAPIAGTLGIDNVQAIPEPAVIVQMIAGLALLIAWIGYRRGRSREEIR